MSLNPTLVVDLVGPDERRSNAVERSRSARRILFRSRELLVEVHGGVSVQVQV
jgi:hypothetical protein